MLTTIEELNMLVEALEGRLEAIKVWASKDHGVVSIDNTDMHAAKKPKLDQESGMYKIKSCDPRDTSPCCPVSEDKVNINASCSSSSHVSSAVVQSGSQDGHNDNGTLVMNAEAKVGHDCNFDLNLNCMFDEHESKMMDISDGCDNKASTFDGNKLFGVDLGLPHHSSNTPSISCSEA
jgi:histone demethylase JARID1